MHTFTDRRLTLLLVAFTALLGAIYVGNAWTPSSYAITLHVLGIEEVKPALGTPRDSRSDEFFVQTPHFQIAVKSGLSDTDQVSPYRETLRNFMALPIKDWSAIFKPTLWGFLILPPAFAYSLYFFLLAAACFWGWHQFLRLLGASFAIALAGSVLICYSQMFQVWWSTIAPTFALAPWVGIAYLSARSETLRFTYVFAAAAVWLFALLYPPFIYAEALTLATAIAAFRRDTLRLRSLAIAACAIALAAGLVFFYLHDTIEVMRNSVYPGRRSLNGGGTPWSQVFTTIFPHFNTIGFDPRPLAPETRNECETGVVGSFLAILVLSFAEFESFRRYWRNHKRSVLLVVIVLALMLAWILAPIPSSIGHLLLLDMVPPTRMLLGFGLLFHVALLVAVGSFSYRITATRLLAFISVVVAIYIVRKSGLPWSVLKNTWFDVAIFLSLAIVLTCRSMIKARNNATTAASLVVAAGIANLITFGTFNPLQSAHPIFAERTDGIVGDLRELQKWDDRELVYMRGWSGSALAGLGIRAVNGTLMSPQTTHFSKEFPDIAADEREQIFNRYGHVTPRFIPAPSAKGDQIYVPIQHYARNSRLRHMDMSTITNEGGTVSTYAVLRADDGRFYIEITGWAPFHGVDASQALIFEGNADAIGATREPRLDVAEATGDPSLRLSGFRAYFERSDGAFPPHFGLGATSASAPQRIPNLLGVAITPQAEVPTLGPGSVPGAIDTWTFDPQSRELTIEGWVGFPPHDTQWIHLPLAGIRSATIERVGRADVAASLGEAWRYSGFRLRAIFGGTDTPLSTATCIIATLPGRGSIALTAPGTGSACATASLPHPVLP